MVESALEFARIARDRNYHNFVFSMKASNPKVMIEAYRLLTARLAEEGDDWNYPIHHRCDRSRRRRRWSDQKRDWNWFAAARWRGRYDSGEFDGRFDLRNPRAEALDKVVTEMRLTRSDLQIGWDAATWDPFSYERRKSAKIAVCGIPLGGDETVRVFTSRKKWDALAHKIDRLGDFKPEIVVEDSGVIAIDPRDEEAVIF